MCPSWPVSKPDRFRVWLHGNSGAFLRDHSVSELVADCHIRQVEHGRIHCRAGLASRASGTGLGRMVRNLRPLSGLRAGASLWALLALGGGSTALPRETLGIFVRRRAIAPALGGLLFETRRATQRHCCCSGSSPVLFGFIWHGAFARAVFLAIALVGASAPAMAQNAIWFGNGAPTADEWNQLNNWSTAGNAAITSSGSLNFNDSGTAANANISSSGILNFNNTSTAGNAVIINNQNL